MHRDRHARSLTAAGRRTRETIGLPADVRVSTRRSARARYYSIAILIAAHAVTRSTAFAIFVGSRTLSPRLASAFTSGAHAAFYASMGFMAAAALLSALRGRHTLAWKASLRRREHAR